MAFAFALLAALVHGYIFYLERLRYGSPTFCRTFGIAREDWLPPAPLFTIWRFIT